MMQAGDVQNIRRRQTGRRHRTVPLCEVFHLQHKKPPSRMDCRRNTFIAVVRFIPSSEKSTSLCFLRSLSNRKLKLVVSAIVISFDRSILHTHKQCDEYALGRNNKTNDDFRSHSKPKKTHPISNCWISGMSSISIGHIQESVAFTLEMPGYNRNRRKM